MLRQALRRVLWLGPTLVLVSLLAFWAVSRPSQGNGLPRFLNPDPDDVVSISAVLVERIAAGGSDGRLAAGELAELGGAALPHVLSRLDALGTEARTRVALALAPIAERMGVARGTEHSTAETTLRFWDRFWQDRSIDFRPVAVRRAVRRAVARPSALRDAEIRTFDTYALDELMAVLAEARDEGDMERLRRTTKLASPIVHRPHWIIGPTATRDEAARVADAYLGFWAEHAHRYVAFRGTSRIFAFLSETQYGRFVNRLARTLGETSRRLGPPAGVTLSLLGLSLVLGHVVGLSLNAFALSRRPLVGVATAVFFVAILALPWPFLGLAAHLWPTAPWWSAALTMTGLTASLVAIHERPTLRGALAHPAAETRRAQGQSDLRTTVRSTKASPGPLAARLAAEVPVVLTICFVFERSFGLHGLGEVVVPAMRDGNVDVLMLVVVSTTALVALVQLLMDLLLGLLAARHVLARRRIGILE